MINKSQLAQKIRELQGLSSEEKSQLLGLINDHKRYGLVWEDKVEEVEEQLQEQLPILSEVTDKRILSAEEDAPNHILIEGDNLHALTCLSYTHEGKIDVIYIDPPYNTGNKDFVYNDSYVDYEDDYRHSKWLSFMAKRLRVARRLLSDKGVILISIDDNEQANLKLLCDEIFGEKNFVCNFIWRGGRRNMAKWVSTSHEYMLLYANNLSFCNSINVEWHEKKRGIEEIYKTASKCLKDCNLDYVKASEALKLWFKQLSPDNPSKDHSHYCWIDEVGVYFAADISRGGGGGPRWEIKNPYTGEIVKTPQRGWAYSRIEDLESDIKEGKVHFNGSGVPCRKHYLKDSETQILETVFYKDRRASSKRLRDLMGNDAFPFPKDELILKEKIQTFASNNSVILDFFAGSGTTMHAVMQLNNEDGGKRQCILVTNNENGICENITYERNRRVIQGYTNSKGEQVEGLSNNSLRYYQTNYVPRERTQRNMRSLVNAATDLLCIQNNLYEEQDFLIDGKKVSKSIARYFGEMLVVYREEYAEEIARAIEGMEIKGKKLKVYIFSPGRYAFDDTFIDVQDKIELVALPAAIYDAYKHVLPKRREKLFEEPQSSIPTDLFSEL